MSSTLYFVNWCPDQITPKLNDLQLSKIKPSPKSSNYFPYTLTVPRDASVPGKPGQWGNVNALVVTNVSSGSSKIYNNIVDPSEAAPNTELRLWIFPDFVVFSQFDKQLGSRVYPS